MLFFFVTARHAYTIRRYQEDWAGAMRDRIRILPYENIPPRGQLESGTYFFTDLERLTRRQMSLAGMLADQIEQQKMKVMNHPHRCLLREPLLKRLFREGINRFDVHALPAGLWRTRLPAFLHSTGNHDGPLGKLYQSRWRLWREAWHRRRRPGWGQMIVEEFSDIKDREGHCHKYGAFGLGGAILPRHYFEGFNWCLKDTEILEAPQQDIYWSYLRKNPHEAELRKIFALAGIDYGRIDYAVTPAGYHVWEINTNPEIISARTSLVPEEMPLAEFFNLRFQDAMKALIKKNSFSGGISYELPRTFAG